MAKKTRYIFNLKYEMKDKDIKSKIMKGNRVLKPYKNEVIITYKITARNAKDALDKLQVRMQDMNGYKYKDYRMVCKQII